MIKSITYKDLFGKAGNDNFIEFYDDLNIITGQNGSGKTTLLKMLWYAISGRFDILVREVPFSYLEIVTDQCNIVIDQRNELIHLKINFTNPANKDKGEDKDIKNYRLLPIIDKHHKSKYFPTFRRIEGGYTIVPKVGEAVENNEIYEDFNHLSERLSSQVNYNHQFIAYVSTNDLNRLLNDEIARNGILKEQINKDQRIKLGELLKENKTKAMATLIAETERKLTKADAGFMALHELVGTHLQKRISLTDNLVIGTGTTEPIHSQYLSAGEKQLFAFLCYNIFAQDASIFIDEPEISLHPNWQRQLIPLLQQQSSSNQFFMTTHSDVIAAPYQHREIELNIKKGY